MIKAIELIILILLLIFSFFAGVKYSEAVTENASWIFEAKEEYEEEEEGSDILDFSGDGIVKLNSEPEEEDDE
jgi:hypothetical protein